MIDEYRIEFESTTKTVWGVLDPWLRLQYGEKCPDYEFGCECCERWKLAEELLAYDRNGTPSDLEKEIESLEELVKWRKELLVSLKAKESLQK